MLGPFVWALRTRTSTGTLQDNVNVRVSSSHEHPPRANPRAYPRHLKKSLKCPALRAIFVGKCPATRSFCGGQMPGTPVHQIRSIYKIISCHILKMFLLLLWSINALHLLQNDSAWLLETLDSERRRKWWKDVTKQVCCCLQKCPGDRDIINCQMPGPGTHRETNARGLPGGGCSRLELTRTYG